MKHIKSKDETKPKESIFFLKNHPTRPKREKKYVLKRNKRLNTKRDSAQRDLKVIPHSWPHQPEGRSGHVL